MYETKIFACSQDIELAQAIASEYGLPLGNVTIDRYKDGEFRPCFQDTVRDAKVFIIGSTYQPTDNFMELLLMLDAVKRSSAHHVTAVIPYFGWARQDRQDRPRVPMAAKLIARTLQLAGADRVITMDLHVDQIQGFFDIIVDHIYASPIFFEYIKQLNKENLVMASPDMGGSKRAYAYSKALQSEVTICYKQRKGSNQIESIRLIGDVKDRDVFIVDDIIDTGGTLIKASEIMKKEGAKSVRAICTHALLSDNAIDRIEASELSELLVTDSIPLRKKSNKIKVLSCAHLIARIMKKINEGHSISGEFNIERS